MNIVLCKNQNLTGIQPDKHSTCVNIALNILLQIVVALLNLKAKIIDIPIFSII